MGAAGQKVTQYENKRRRAKRLVYCWISLTLHSPMADTLQRSKLKPSERLVQRFWFILTCFLGFR